MENRNLVISATRASGTPSFDPQGPSSQPPQAEASEEQLYKVSITSGGLHAGLGLLDRATAGTFSVNSASVELHLNRTVPLQIASEQVDSSATPVVRGHVDFSGVASQCCPATLWPVIAVLQQLQQQQHQQLHQQLQWQLMQQHSSHQSVSSPAPVDTGSGTSDLRQRSQMSNDTQLNEPPTAADISSAAIQDGLAQPAVAGEAAADVSATEATLHIQWEVCLQTSSHSQIQVVAETGTILSYRHPAYNTVICNVLVYRLSQSSATCMDVAGVSVSHKLCISLACA